MKIKLYLIIGAATLILLCLLGHSINNYIHKNDPKVYDVYNMQEVYNNYKKQLPDNHWLRVRNIDISPKLEKHADDWFLRNASMLMFASYAVGGEKIGPYRTLTSPEQKEFLKHFILRDIEGKEIKKIKVKTGETIDVNILRKGKNLAYDLKEEEFSVVYLKRYTANYKQLDDFSMGYVKDSSIASFNNGSITGITKGKTYLYVCANGFVFKYQIKVK